MVPVRAHRGAKGAFPRGPGGGKLRLMGVTRAIRRSGRVRRIVRARHGWLRLAGARARKGRGELRDQPGRLQRPRRVRGTPGRAPRSARSAGPGLALAAVTVAAVAGATACDPDAAGGLNSAAVALATDQAGTRALEQAGLTVQWMSCTAEMGTRPGAPSPSAGSSGQVARVNCEGETKDRKKLTIKGKVTEEREGRCVRGDLTATAGDRVVFRVQALGNCGTGRPTGSGQPTRTTTGRPTDGPTSRPTVTETVRPPSSHEPSDPAEPPDRPPVTVTVTSTPSPPPGPSPSGTCGCDGKDTSPGHEAARAGR